MCQRGEIPGAFRISDRGKSRWRIPFSSEDAFVKGRQVEAAPKKEEVKETP
jgi:hypothetical protein